MSLQLFNRLKVAAEKLTIPSLGDTQGKAQAASDLHFKVRNAVAQYGSAKGGWAAHEQRYKDADNSKVIGKLQDTVDRKSDLYDLDRITKATSLIPGLSPISNTVRALTAAGGAAGIGPTAHRFMTKSRDGLDQVARRALGPYSDTLEQVERGFGKLNRQVIKPATQLVQDTMKKLNQDNHMSTPHIKTASEATPARLAAIDKFDGEQAFELGFAKAAHDLGLNEQQYAQFYQAGIAKLQALQK